MSNEKPKEVSIIESLEALKTDDERLEHLANLTPLDYERNRLEAAEKLGITRVAILDKEVKKIRAANNSEDGSKGQSVNFEEITPHDESVSGDLLLNLLEETFDRYLILPKYASTTLALWSLFTYCYDAFHICPILSISSPEKRCGKTTLLRLLRRIVYRALPASNITPPAVFRTISVSKPCLLIDEADTFMKDNEELRGVMNSGHTRDTAFAIRMVKVGEDQEPRRFTTWCPKGIAYIGKMKETIEDRSVIVPMRRKAPGEKVIRLKHADTFQEIQGMCLSWALDNTLGLGQSEPETPDGLHDRAIDNWEPLLDIADIAGGEWPEKARKAAASLSGDAEIEDSSIKVQLLIDIKSLFERRDYLTSTQLADALKDIEDRPWPEFGRTGKPITARKISSLLKPFGISPKRLSSKPNITDGTRGYEKNQFHDAFARYTPSEVSKCHFSKEINDLGDFQSVKEECFSGALNAKKPNKINGLTDLTLQKGGVEKNAHNGRLLTLLTAACDGLDLTVEKFRDYCADDLEDIENGVIGPETLRQIAERIANVTRSSPDRR